MDSFEDKSSSNLLNLYQCGVCEEYKLLIDVPNHACILQHSFKKNFFRCDEKMMFFPQSGKLISMNKYNSSHKQ